MATQNKDFKVKHGLVVAQGATFGGEVTASKIKVPTVGGDEGGEIYLGPAATNTTLAGGVTIDVYQNKLRIFEQGGSARGAYIDLSAAAAGVASNLLAGGGTGGTGTVTSVSMTVPTGLTVSGSPITTSGTLAVSLSSGYSIPTTTSQTNWDSAYGWGNHASAGYLTTTAAASTYQPIGSYLTSAVTSIAGTTNQITASASTGSVTLAFPAAITVDTINVATLNVSGTQNIFNTTNLSITDSLIYLADSQFNADVLDIGIYGAYGDSGAGHWHTGLVRDATDGTWKLISGADEPVDNVINFSTATYDTLLAGAFKKNGGTSSQFLKADGSVDSNTYITSVPIATISVSGTVKIDGTTITITNGVISAQSTESISPFMLMGA